MCNVYECEWEDEYVYEQNVHVYKDERVCNWCNSLLVSFFICNCYLFYIYKPHPWGMKCNRRSFPSHFLSVCLSLSLVNNGFHYKRKNTTMTNLLQSIEPLLYYYDEYYYDSKLNATLHTNSNGKYDDM